jgi:hypothetical protein
VDFTRADFSLIEILFGCKEITGLNALLDVPKSAHPVPLRTFDLRAQAP